MIVVRITKYYICPQCESRAKETREDAFTPVCPICKERMRLEAVESTGMGESEGKKKGG